MPDELIVNELENLLSQVVELGASAERTRMAPNLLVTNPSPAGLSNYITVKDDRDGDNILALKVPGVVYNTNDLVNVLFIRGGEAIAFQQGSGSSSSGIWGVISGTSTDIFYNSGDVSIGKAPAPDARLEIVDTAQAQLRLTYTDATKFVDFTLDTNHDLTVTPSSNGQVIFQPTTNSTDFFQVLDSSGSTTIVADPTNKRLGVNVASPATNIHLENAGTNAQSIMRVATYNDQVLFPSDFQVIKSHTDTQGSLVSTIDTEILGRFVFLGVNSSNGFGNAAIISAVQNGAASTNCPTNLEFRVSTATSSNVVRMLIEQSGLVGFNIGITTPSAQVHIDQSDSSGAIPVLLLDQADVDEPFTKYIGVAAAATLTRSIVAEADVTTATRQGFIKIEVQDDGNQVTDQDYFVPFFTLA